MLNFGGVVFFVWRRLPSSRIPIFVEFFCYISKNSKVEVPKPGPPPQKKKRDFLVGFFPKAAAKGSFKKSVAIKDCL